MCTTSHHRCSFAHYYTFVCNIPAKQSKSAGFGLHPFSVHTALIHCWLGSQLQNTTEPSVVSVQLSRDPFRGIVGCLQSTVIGAIIEIVYNTYCSYIAPHFIAPLPLFGRDENAIQIHSIHKDTCILLICTHFPTSCFHWVGLQPGPNPLPDELFFCGGHFQPIHELNLLYPQFCRVSVRPQTPHKCSYSHMSSTRS